MSDKPHGPVGERMMRNFYGPSGYDKGTKVRAMKFTARSRLDTYASASRLQSEQETYDMAVNRDVELKSLRSALFQMQEAAKQIHAEHAAMKRDFAHLQAVARAAAELCDNVEESDDGAGLLAQNGWWEPLHDALRSMNGESDE